MATVTVIILAKNEEQHMKDCIASAQFADEVLLIDDGSTDKTVEIAESMGARVVHHAMNGDWSQQRRFAVEEARSEWIFFLDADERISPELQPLPAIRTSTASWAGQTLLVSCWS